MTLNPNNNKKSIIQSNKDTNKDRNKDRNLFRHLKFQVRRSFVSNLLLY